MKKSANYYDDASQVLVEIMINQCRPDFNLMPSTRAPLTRAVARDEESGPGQGGSTAVHVPRAVRGQSKGFNALFDKVSE